MLQFSFPPLIPTEEWKACMYARMQRGLMAKALNPRYDTAMDLKLETTVTSIDVVGALFPAWMKRCGEVGPGVVSLCRNLQDAFTLLTHRAAKERAYTAPLFLVDVNSVLPDGWRRATTATAAWVSVQHHSLVTHL